MPMGLFSPYEAKAPNSLQGTIGSSRQRLLLQRLSESRVEEEVTATLPQPGPFCPTDPQELRNPDQSPLV